MKPRTPRSVSSSWPRAVAAALLALCLGMALYAVVASADLVLPVINEFVANHDGSTSADDHEYIEVRGAANTSYGGYVILSIEGDYDADDPMSRGIIDAVFSITTTNAGGYWWTGFLTDSLDKSTMTLLLVNGFSGTPGQDLDTDNNGGLDVTPWAAVVDAVAVSDGGENDRTYAAAVLPYGFGGGDLAPAPGGASRIPDGRDTDSTADWTLNDFEGEGLPGFSGALSATEARNTPGSRNLKPTRLAVVRAGPGVGSVVSDPAGVNCGAICTTSSFSAYDAITLTAAAQTGFTFAGWSGPCAGSGLCSFVLTQPMTVTATFTHSEYALTVSVHGSGSVASHPAGITCGSDCSQLYTHGAAVELTATPAIGWSFGGWSGACTGGGECNVMMTGVRAVTATFTLNQYDLTVNKRGHGTVSSIPAGIACGGECTHTYSHGIVANLAAVADPGWSFAGWNGACTGTSACSVMIDGVKVVTATFTLNTYTLTVNRDGGGTIASDPAGITCGVGCNHIYAHGTTVNLAATADPGWSFNGWGGACSGANGCSVTMDETKTVSASFTRNQYALTVNVAGSGSGTVTSDHGEIDCGPVCSVQLEHGDEVTLAANADEGSSFSGWSGACSGSGACKLTMTTARAVTATFSAQPVEERSRLYLPALER